jgi:crotonobetainyl-CoA:carnitine CoA-transferase CaiB-like acyl-CoA transferase
MINGEPCVSSRPAPKLGEHTAEILQSLEAPAATLKLARGGKG